MQYFGVPVCPYCKKRVNVIRTWSLKRQGEYKCPRCGGISNIFLSPLIYVVALIAIFAGGAVYFFHKFVLDDVSVSTALQVVIPFIVFFLLSLFMVYLAKPVIKKVSRAEMEQKKRGNRGFENRRLPAGAPSGQTGRIFTEYDDEYVPQIDYRTGPVPMMEGDEDMKIHAAAPRPQSNEDNLQHTSVVDIYEPQPQPPRQQAPVRETPMRVRQEQPPVQRRRTPVSPPVKEQPAYQEPAPAPRVVGSVEIPAVNDDFFAKYDDPEYVNRRLREVKDNRNDNN